MIQIPASAKVRAATLALLAISWVGCSVLATRPVQEMSDTHAAIRAAREVQADTLAPELYRQSSEWFSRARREYKFKNFSNAKDFADKARRYAEQAEFEAIRNNGVRSELPPEQPTRGNSAEPPKPSSYEYPTPTGTPADVYDQRQKEEEARRNPPTPQPGTSLVPVPVPGLNELPPINPVNP